MPTFALVLNLAGLVAALAIAVAGGFLVAVVTHARLLLQLGATLLSTAAILTLPVWSLTIAWRWQPGAGVAVWIIPSIYLVLLVPLVKLLFGATGAAAQP
ncbi:MAG: hypothetical protein NT062_25585 [Proteobacteria bacterium]|nr:hypothetical protein [Pseudomonadota bacterium]